MAWIESHQALRSHPKTLKAARALGIRPVYLMGHLHALWHWALDLADDGNLSKFDSTDIALGADWDGDPDEFVDALVGCGFGDGPGFLARNAPYGHPDDGLLGALVLHDWWDYAGKLVSRRIRDRERKAKARTESEGVPADISGKSKPIPEDVQGTSNGRSADVQRSAGNDLYQPTNQPKEPTETEPPPSSADADGSSLEFERFWRDYPRRNGIRVGKREALAAWKRLKPPERQAAMDSLPNYRDACDRGVTLAKDAHRWIKGRHWGEWTERAPTAAGDGGPPKW